MGYILYVVVRGYVWVLYMKYICCGGWGIYTALILFTLPKNKALITLCRGDIYFEVGYLWVYVCL